jgi:site-specific recombinase XerD
MNGRLESHLRLATKTEQKLTEMPSYVSEWYYKLKSKQSATTCSEYISKIYRFLKYTNDNIKEIKTTDFSYINTIQYYNSLMYKDTSKGKAEYSDSYKITTWFCLNSFFSFLYNRHYIEENFMKDIDRPKNNDLDRILEETQPVTIKDFKRILKANSFDKNKIERKRNKAILVILMQTGMRKSALLNMNLDSIDLEKKQLLVIDKGDKLQKYPINDMMEEAINEWLDVRKYYLVKAKGNDREALFLSNRGKRLATRTLNDMVEKYSLIGIGRKISPHKIRSGYITTIIEKTKNPELARRAAGHKSFETTKRYYRTDNNEREVAANLISSLL